MSLGVRATKHKRPTRSATTPIARRPSYQRRQLMKNVSQSIQAHINRLAQPVVRNPVARSPFAFLQERISTAGKPYPDRMKGFRLPRKHKRRKVKKHSKTAKKSTGVANMQQENRIFLPAHMSTTIANFEKARLTFLESLSQIQKQIANLKLPGPILEPIGSKASPKKAILGSARPKTVCPLNQASVKLAPPPTKGVPPRPGTPMKNQLNNIQHLLGPKLRDMMAKAKKTNLPSWIV